MDNKSAEWFLNKYLEWQKEQKKVMDQFEFANFLGFGQPTVSLWLSGKRTPGKSAADQIYMITKDPSIYDAIGLVRPNSTIDYELSDISSNLSDAERTDLLSFARALLSRHKADTKDTEETN